MQRAVRSSVTAGVALLGAGVIAASPIAPPVPDIHLPAIHVDATALAAAVSPIDTYQQVFDDRERQPRRPWSMRPIPAR